MHFLEFNRRRNLWEFVATCAHENIETIHMAVFVKIDGHRSSGVLKELEVCAFDKTWSACQ